MKSFCFFLLALILSVIVLIYVFNAGNESTLWWMMACGALFLLVAGILWIVTMFKENKEYQRTNKEYDQYEKEAEEALAAEIEAVKGNSLKKELVKRRLVRVYIEKNHPEASRHVDNSKFDGWYDCVSAFFCSGSVLFSPLLWGLGVLLLIVLPLFLFGTLPYKISPSYYVVTNAVFAVVAVATLVWKRYYVVALVACTLAVIYVIGICTVGTDNILQRVYVMMIECVDNNFLNYGFHKSTICCSFLLITMFSFCLMVYPFIKNWAISLWLYVLGIWVFFPMDMNFIIWKLYMIRSAIVAYIAVVLGMPYAATHMLLFVYMLSLLPVLSALPAFIRAWLACRKQDEKTRANRQYTEKCERVFRKCMIWLIINIVAMTLLWCHFIGLSFIDAQSLLEDDCERIADFTGFYYNIVYIIAVVVLPLLSIKGSILCYNYTKKQIK